MKQPIYPFRTGVKFSTLEDLRRAISDLEATAREQGCPADTVYFSDEFLLSLVSERLTDGSTVLNATVAISPKHSTLSKRN